MTRIRRSRRRWRCSRCGRERYRLMPTPSDVETASSTACGRAGTFALLIALALAAMCPEWIRLRELAALAEYMTWRVRLVLAIEYLDADETWKNYLEVSPNAEQLTLGELLAARVEVSSSNSPVLSAPPVSPNTFAPSTSAVSALRLSPPTNLRISTNIAAVEYIAEPLKKLNDASLLARSQKASNLAAISIARWITKRDQLQRRKDAVTIVGTPTPRAHPPATREDAPNDPRSSSEVNETVGRLRMTYIRTLSAYLAPVYDDPLRVAELRSIPVDFAPGALPKSLFWATVSAQLLLGFVVAYFTLFFREARQSSSFPSPGTLFGVFSRSRTAQIVFLSAVVAPALASVAVAAFARGWYVAATTAMVVVATLSAVTSVWQSGLISVSPRLPNTSHI
jgi:hypothetical protein